MATETKSAGVFDDEDEQRRPRAPLAAKMVLPSCNSRAYRASGSDALSACRASTDAE